MNLLILAAGEGKRLSLSKPKSLCVINEETILNRIIRIGESLFENLNTYVVTGFAREYMLPFNFEEIANEDYETTNTAGSLRLGLSHIKGPVLVIFGDIVFSEQILSDEYFNESFIIYDKSINRSSAAGCNIDVSGYACHFAYGLPQYWSHIVYLKEKEKELFLKYAHPRHFCFEVFNQVLNRGGTFKGVPAHSTVLEIDTPAELEFAKQNIGLLDFGK